MHFRSAEKGEKAWMKCVEISSLFWYGDQGWQGDSPRMSEVLEAIRPLFSETVQTSKWCDIPWELVKQMGGMWLRVVGGGASVKVFSKMQLRKNHVKGRL